MNLTELTELTDSQIFELADNISYFTNYDDRQIAAKLYQYLVEKNNPKAMIKLAEMYCAFVNDK